MINAAGSWFKGNHMDEMPVYWKPGEIYSLQTTDSYNSAAQGDKY